MKGLVLVGRGCIYGVWHLNRSSLVFGGEFNQYLVVDLVFGSVVPNARFLIHSVL